MTWCRYCGPPSASSGASDAQILAALSGPISTRLGTRIFTSMPELYVAAGPNEGGADWSTWYVTGPPEREGYVAGPFSLAQVQRLVESGRLQVGAVDRDGNIHSYSLRTEPFNHPAKEG